MRLICCFTLLVSLSNCQAQALNAPGKLFKAYWFNGQAEITSFSLIQARYGNSYPGEAVLIFVTEDFSRSQQVKLDHPRAAGTDAVNVLKCNLTKKFTTGIYPYSMMLSSFVPTSGGMQHPLKVTASCQEWCGQSFTQLNQIDHGYQLRAFSYFEQEGDVLKDLDGNYWLEDEIWQQIRINPDALPTGKIEMIPGLLFTRLRHQPVQPVRAECRFVQEESNKIRTYHIRYQDMTRELMIHFEAEFPYRILSWKEITENGFGPDPSITTTEAIRKETIRLDYWNHHEPVDSTYRQALGLKSVN